MKIGGLLLTGGESRRFGAAKHDVRVRGERLVDRSARALTRVCDEVLEVGPGVSNLHHVQEDPPGSGPLAALAAGADALRMSGHADGVLVLAVDLPLVDSSLLSWIARHPAATSVVPRVAGAPQPVCARYSEAATVKAGRLVTGGARSMHALLDEIDVTYVDEAEWGTVCGARVFTDIDTPEDLAALEAQGWQ